MLLFIYCLLLLQFGFCVWPPLFCCIVLGIFSSFAIIYLKKNELVAMLKIQPELSRPILWNQISDVHRGSTLIGHIT